MNNLFSIFENMGLKRKLIFSFSILIVIPMVVLGIFSLQSSTRVINEQSAQYYRNTLSQTAEYYKNIFSEIEAFSYLLIGNEDLNYLLNSKEVTKEYIDAYDRFDMLSEYFMSKPYILSLSASKDGRIIYQKGAAVPQEEKNQWYERAVNLKGKVVWSDAYTMKNLIDLPDAKVVSLYREIIDLDRNTPIGVIRITVSEETLYNLYKDLDLGEGAKVYIIDKNGLVISHPNKDFIGLPALEKEFIDKIKDSKKFNTRILSNNRVAFSYRIGTSDYSILGIIPLETINNESIPVKSLIMLTLFGCLVFAAILMFYLSKRIVEPIKLLSEKMDAVERGNFDVFVSVKVQDDMGKLANHFNNMVIRIKTLIRDLYEVKLREKEAELKALQEQINPHFLYNTLDTIRWTARKNGDFESSEYIEVLSSILRYNLNNGLYDTDIGSEMSNLMDYIFLQEKRYGDKISVYFNIDESLFGYKIIKLSIQPLLENSIKHGFSNKNSEGYIFVDGELSEGNIKITVTDNGVGANEKTINEIINSKTETERVYALKNINERIKLHFGDEYGLKFYSSKDNGTKVEIVFPAIEHEAYMDKGKGGF